MGGCKRGVMVEERYKNSRAGRGFYDRLRIVFYFVWDEK